jgi:hypothetical protein
VSQGRRGAQGAATATRNQTMVLGCGGYLGGGRGFSGRRSRSVEKNREDGVEWGGKGQRGSVFRFFT